MSELKRDSENTEERLSDIPEEEKTETQTSTAENTDAAEETDTTGETDIAAPAEMQMEAAGSNTDRYRIRTR